MVRPTADSRQCCYLEIVVRFNRDIPTLIPASRVPDAVRSLCETSCFLCSESRQLLLGDSYGAFASLAVATAEVSSGPVSRKLVETSLKKLYYPGLPLINHQGQSHHFSEFVELFSTASFDSGFQRCAPHGSQRLLSDNIYQWRMQPVFINNS